MKMLKPIPENLDNLSPQLRYYYTHRKDILEWQSQYHKDKWKNRNSEKTREKWNSWRESNPEKNKLRMKRWYKKYGKEYEKKKQREKRLIVIVHYGGKCICCGETEIRFLEIDHIHGGGTKERLKLKMRGSSLVNWIIRNNFPKGYQLLCADCNRAKNASGKQFCPVHHPELYLTSKFLVK